ncbi:alpha-glucosidase [Flavobacterium sp. MK4S-17]|uniref:alpha-glucosidase n=1 Tax=Flavobacterium sp. MK4S-17 TaxID=2543737 RepID=UPI0013567615|nr:alpha-glucosidase [Flavobacterium sp. MK4S-17]
MNYKLLAPLIFFFINCTYLKAQHADKIWWKESVFYQIYMPSYADSNGDGYGDFKGITSKLDYLQKLGVKGIWLTPFLFSPKVDNGYDVADYYKVDPVYGSMADFEYFLNEAHKRNIKVIMDMVLNHTSTESRWFQEAKQSKDNPYRDYYIWRDKPNNWESFFGGPAWEYDTITQQYYYHKFDVRMADLNWQNPKVKQEVKNILKFWLDKGIDGFRLDVINFLTTNGITDDNPLKNGSQQHLHDIDQPGVKDAMRMIKATVNEYPEKFIVGEIGSDKIEVLKQYQSNELLDVVFNFNFGSIPAFSAEGIYKELKSMEEHMGNYPTLFFGSHDMPRMIDRLAGGDAKKAEALATIILTAKGIPFIYYGEEIGMQNITANSYNEIIDIQGKTHYRLAINKGNTVQESLTEANKHNRDKSRSPMQWSDATFAGFSNRKSWIKISPSYKTNNVQKLEKEKNSIFNSYKKLIALRNKTKALQYGEYEELNYLDERISYVRNYKNEKVTVIINFGKQHKIEIPENSVVLQGNVNLGLNEYIIFTEKNQ